MRLVTLLLLLAALAAAQDEPAPKAGDKKKEAAEKKAEEPVYDWVLTFQNGDTVHCQLRALEARKLRVRWAIAPESPVTLDLAQIAEVQRVTAIEADNRAGTDVLRLRDGSQLYGRAVRFSPEVLEFEVSQLGLLKFEGKVILDLARDGYDRTKLETSRGEHHVVATKAGQLLLGKLEQTGDGKLVVKSEGLTASIDYTQVAAVMYPDETLEESEATAKEEEKKAIPGVQVKLRDGSAVSGKEPSMKDGILSFKLGSGHAVKVPLAELQGVGFMDFGDYVGRAGIRSLLVWSRWADPGDELRKTMNIINSELKGWRVTDDKSDNFDRAFRRKLFRSRTLLIPEMEKWRVANPTALGRSFKPMAEAFLRSGGNIVICGVQNQHLVFLREAGLIELRVQSSVDNQTIRFTAKGKGLGKGVGGSWRAVNATFGYTVVGRQKTTVLAETGSRGVAVGRRVGRGWVIVLGMDYYMTNKGASRVLANAVRLR